jgi:uncharacterized protein
VSRSVVIVDTNVVAAGLLTSDETSPVARILDGMLGATLPFVLSEALLAEYHAVLTRPKLRALHGLTVAEIEIVLTCIAQHTILLVPVAGTRAPDRGDQLLWDLLAARAGLLLVTGDKRLVRDVGMRGRVVSPAAFIAPGLDAQ